VDGYFQWAPSVWHKEILWAMQEGVHVFGAASMGALRAAELAPFGMRGVGRIFQAYRDGVLTDCGDDPFEDDDEVAVVHGPSESSYIAASEAMVDIRCTLACAETAGVIAAATRARLIGIAKALYFPERSYKHVFERARATALPEAELTALESWLPAGRVNQKRIDALAMLETMRHFLAANPARVRTSFHFEHTSLWEEAVAELLPVVQHKAEEALALDELRLNCIRFHELRREVLQTLLGESDTDAAGEPPPGGRSDAQHLMEELARQDAKLRAQDEVPPVLIERQILARVRATGEYEKLLARAQDKRARLAEQADLPYADEFSEPQLLQLRDWYFSRVTGGDMPEDLGRYLRDAGYPDEMRFHEAIFAEYVYRRMAADAAGSSDRAAGREGA
jgi:hypothetical protein